MDTAFDITVTKVTGLAVTCKMEGNKDWGDGTTDASTSHIYTEYGDYTITCDGTVIPAGHGGEFGGVFGTSFSNVNRYWCTAVRVGDNVTSIGVGAFFHCRALTSVSIPEGITNIPMGAFEGCYALTNIVLPNSVTDIGAYAFYGCYSLTELVIPDSVTSIGAYAFMNCQTLNTVVMPKGITSIDYGAFEHCFALIKYDFTAATAVPTLANTNAFSNINGICKIVVPANLYDDWIVDGYWYDFADYIIAA